MLAFRHTDRFAANPSQVGTRLWVLALGLALVFTNGCNQKRANRGIVTGRITVNGELPERGMISFTPIDGLSPAAGGKVVAGEYSVDAWIGPSKVAIRIPKVVGKQKLYNTPNSPLQEVRAESLPAKFNDETELKFDVAVGSNQKDFDLSNN